MSSKSGDAGPCEQCKVGFKQLCISLALLAVLECGLCYCGSNAVMDLDTKSTLWVSLRTSMLLRVICLVLGCFVTTMLDRYGQKHGCFNALTFLGFCCAIFIALILPFAFLLWYLQVISTSMLTSCTVREDLLKISTITTGIVASELKNTIHCGDGTPPLHVFRDAISFIVPICIPVTFKLLLESVITLTHHQQQLICDQQLLRMVLLHVVDICTFITIAFRVSAFLWLHANPNWSVCIVKVLPYTSSVATAILVCSIFYVKAKPKKEKVFSRCFAGLSLGIDVPFSMIRTYHMWCGIHVEPLPLAKNLFGIMFALAEIGDITFLRTSLNAMVGLFPDSAKVTDLAKAAEHARDVKSAKTSLKRAETKCKAIVHIQRSRRDDSEDLVALAASWELFATATSGKALGKDKKGNALIPETYLEAAMKFLDFTIEEKTEFRTDLSEIGAGADSKSFKSSDLAQAWVRRGDALPGTILNLWTIQQPEPVCLSGKMLAVFDTVAGKSGSGEYTMHGGGIPHARLDPTGSQRDLSMIDSERRPLVDC